MTYPEPLKVSYEGVLGIVPTLLADERYDIILHIGLAARRTFYTLERQSLREPYWKEKDVDGNVFSKEKTELLWSDCPNILKPTFNTEDVWRRWKSRLAVSSPDSDIRPSDDPGNYLCGFVYYLSMSWFFKRNHKGERPVMFLHVPDCPNPADVEEGRTIAIELIRALVESKQKAVDSDLQNFGLKEVNIATSDRWSGK